MRRLPAGDRVTSSLSPMAFSMDDHGSNFLSSAFSLNCYHCTSTGSDCSTNEKPCEKTFDICLSTITETITQGKGTTKSIVRSCGTKDMCNVTYSISLNATNLYATTKCCERDKCPTSSLEVPKVMSENKVACMTCNEPNEKCKNAIKIKCTGEEKKCASYTAIDAKTKVSHSAQACVTENVCAMKNVTVLPYDQILTKQFDCSNQAPALLPGLLFPAAIGIAMLKLLS
ncbi:phospholipase A2 inhibitor NAI-like isoform X2 [Dendrobates tinctorius]|uniref:phospholipase A2 inhibitor NAI-like isoform X2 n=1 Tax=Dendrobates tinctorius TaxID=92724 RepID=UPI003CC96E74